MTDFTLTEDVPNSEIEFDQRFSNTETCYEYLAQIKWPDGYTCEKCGHIAVLQPPPEGRQPPEQEQVAAQSSYLTGGRR